MSRETAEKALSKAPIRLEEAERSVLDALLAVARAEGKGTVLRVAGGWVRDKLLGRPCHDIDIALDNVSGSEFADVIGLELDNKPGALARLLQRFADEHINVEYAYTSAAGVGKALGIFRLDNPKKAMQILSQSSANGSASDRDGGRRPLHAR